MTFFGIFIRVLGVVGWASLSAVLIRGSVGIERLMPRAVMVTAGVLLFVLGITFEIYGLLVLNWLGR